MIYFVDDILDHINIWSDALLKHLQREVLVLIFFLALLRGSKLTEHGMLSALFKML